MKFVSYLGLARAPGLVAPAFWCSVWTTLQALLLLALVQMVALAVDGVKHLTSPGACCGRREFRPAVGSQLRGRLPGQFSWLCVKVLMV